MAWYPGAIKKEITANKGRQKMAVYNRINLHTAVSEAASLFGYFNQPGVPDSHFYVRKDGAVEQYVDTAMRANADLEGNDATISIETQGGMKKPESEKWTKKQRKAIAKLVAWIAETHNIPLRLAKNSKLGASSKGLSWHRLGIDGNFRAKYPLAGRRQLGGGMKYSNAYGKTCPGTAKIKQIDGILKDAKKASGAVSKPSKPVSKPKPSKPSKSKKAAKLTADGYWGKSTTRRLQQVLGTVADGEIWGQNQQCRANNPGLTSGWQWVAPANTKASPAIHALQRRLGVAADGLIGPATIRALQRRVGTVADGSLWRKSPAIKKFQKRLNKGKIQ